MNPSEWQARSAPPVSAAPSHPDYIYVVVMVVCVTVLGTGAAVAAIFLQRAMEPAGSVLFGPTPLGGILMGVPSAILGVALALSPSRALALRIRQVLHRPVPTVALRRVPTWIEEANWRVVGVATAIALLAIAAKGFGSYFYITHGGVAVRAPFEFSFRHYEWRDVDTVTVRCTRAENGRLRFRYALRMSDGYYVELSRAPAPRFSASLPTVSALLDSSPKTRYEFEVTAGALEALGKRYGAVLESSIKEQVLSHGGTVHVDHGKPQV